MWNEMQKKNHLNWNGGGLGWWYFCGNYTNGGKFLSKEEAFNEVD